MRCAYAQTLVSRRQRRAVREARRAVHQPEASAGRAVSQHTCRLTAQPLCSSGSVPVLPPWRDSVPLDTPASWFSALACRTGPSACLQIPALCEKRTAAIHCMCIKPHVAGRAGCRPFACASVKVTVPLGHSSFHSTRPALLVSYTCTPPTESRNCNSARQCGSACTRARTLAPRGCRPYLL
jgi:hypothetical protein